MIPKTEIENTDWQWVDITGDANVQSLVVSKSGDIYISGAFTFARFYPEPDPRPSITEFLCTYCGGKDARRNMRGGQECSSCGAPKL